MIFSSLSSYPDPPSWHHQGGVLGEDGVNTGTGTGTGTDSGGGERDICQLPPPLLLSPPSLLSDGGTGTERSFQIPDPRRITNLPPPDSAMKCPRCESTNTKFCYFNNYSLSQPRHFCKTCRRYWTRGGALRNVPVGGSCRRNKKTNKGSRSSRSKSPSTATPIGSTSTTSNTQISHTFPLLPPFNHLGGADLGLTDMINHGVNHSHDSNYPRTKFAQFGVMDQASDPGMYGEGQSSYGGQIAGLKMEEIHHHHHHHHHQQQQEGMNMNMNLSRNFMGISGNDQFVGTSNIAWGTTTTDHLNGFASSSTTTSHLL